MKFVALGTSHNMSENHFEAKLFNLNNAKRKKVSQFTLESPTCENVSEDKIFSSPLMYIRVAICVGSDTTSATKIIKFFATFLFVFFSKFLSKCVDLMTAQTFKIFRLVDVESFVYYHEGELDLKMLKLERSQVVHEMTLK